MSNAKNTQTEKAAATETPVKKDGPMVYCGPTVKNTVKQYTVYHDSKAVPDAVNRFLDRQQKPFGYNHFLYNYGKPDILRDAVY